MFVYLFTFFICVTLSYMADVSCEKGIRCIYLCLCVFLLSLIGGVRDMGVGTDTITYSFDYFVVGRFNTIKEIVNLQDGDIAYYLLNVPAAWLSNHIWAALFVPQLFTIGLTYYGVYKLSDYYEIKYSIFTYLFCFVFYLSTYNYMRQFCALGLMPLAFYYALQHKWLTYLILQTIAFFFHKSSLLFVMVPMIYFFVKSNINRTFLYLSLSTAIIVAIYVAINFFSVLEAVVDMGLIDEVYGSRYGEDSLYSETTGGATLPRSSYLLYLFIYLLIYIAYKENILSWNESIFLFLIHTIYIIVYAISFYIFYLYRMSFYYYYIEIIFLSHILSSTKMGKTIMLLFYFLISYNAYALFVKGHLCEVIPYTSLILGIV